MLGSRLWRQVECLKKLLWSKKEVVEVEVVVVVEEKVDGKVEGKGINVEAVGVEEELMVSEVVVEVKEGGCYSQEAFRMLIKVP